MLDLKRLAFFKFLKFFSFHMLKIDLSRGQEGFPLCKVTSSCANTSPTYASIDQIKGVGTQLILHSMLWDNLAIEEYFYDLSH